MTPLLRRLATRIAMSGPLTVADFMGEALAHGRHGYYRTGDPLGAGGDFTTAPEISQVFGELIGAWLAERWLAMGSPSRVHLVELGPGRGTLMADALRASRGVAGFHDAFALHLVEINDTLRGLQAAAIAGAAPGIAPVWHGGFAEVPDDAPLLLVANEFFDALPIRQFQRTERDWRERLVGFDGDGLRFVLAPGPSPLAPLLAPALADAAPGTVAELCLAGRALAAEIAGRLARRPGAALIVDYGYATARAGDSLQAIAAHRPVGPLSDPGNADLSAHVDFAALAASATAAGARVLGPVPQRDFLNALGIGLRAETLKRRANAAQAHAVDAGVARLIDPEQMGTLFLALALVNPSATGPAGFPVVA